jgi:hypothetical protein
MVARNSWKLTATLSGAVVVGLVLAVFFAEWPALGAATEGLIAYYPFDGDLADYSGNSNDGIASGHVDFMEGRIGQAVKLYGVLDQGFIRVPNSTSLAIFDAFTIAFALRLDGSLGQTSANCSGATAIGAPQCILAKRGDRVGLWSNVYARPADGSLKADLGANASRPTEIGILAVTPYTLGTWVHVAFVYSAGQVVEYIDGVEVARETYIATDFSTVNASDLYIGIQKNDPGACLTWWYPLNGAIDELRIYGRALPAAEVSSLARMSSGPPVVSFPDPNLEQAVRAAIGKPTGAIYKSDLEALVELWADSKGISDLTGLEECSVLEGLFLRDNRVASLDPLSGLTDLRVLDLGENEIVDIGPITDLVALDHLWLEGNHISDVSPVVGLNALQTVSLMANSISDIQPLVDGGWHGDHPVLALEDNYLDLAPGSADMLAIAALIARGVEVLYAPQRTLVTLSVVADPVGGGVVTGAGTYPSGTLVTLSATPSSGYRFVNWTEGGSEVSTRASYVFLASASRNLVAHFASQAGIVAEAEPLDGGRVFVGGGPFTQGPRSSEIWTTAVPNPGFRFVDWTENDVQVSTEPTFKVSGTHRLVAHFAATPGDGVQTKRALLVCGQHEGQFEAALQQMAVTLIECLLFDTANVEIYRVGDGTGSDLQLRTRNWCATADGDDLMFFYYVGHGTEPGYGMEGISGGSLLYTSYSPELTAWLGNPAAETVIVLDTCYSGLAIDTLRTPSGLTGTGRFVLTATTAEGEATGWDPTRISRSWAPFMLFTSGLTDGLWDPLAGGSLRSAFASARLNCIPLESPQIWPADGDVVFRGTRTSVLSPLVLIVASPVHVTITDPLGRVLSLATNTIGPSAFYVEAPFGSGADTPPPGAETHIVCEILIPVPGTYTAAIVPEQDADPADTFSLFVLLGDTLVLSICDQRIDQLPTTPYTFVVGQEQIVGDVNSDGAINIIDVRMADQIASGTSVSTTDQRAVADVDHDSDVDMDDVRILAEYVVGIRTTLP